MDPEYLQPVYTEKLVEHVLNCEDDFLYLRYS